MYTAPITPAVGGSTVGAVAGGAALPITVGLQILAASRRARERRNQVNAQIAAAGGNPNPSFPGYDQYGNPQVENPDSPGVDMAGFSYLGPGPGSGPMTNPTTGGVRTIADVARTGIGLIPAPGPNEGQVPTQLPTQTPLPGSSTVDPAAPSSTLASPSLLSRVLPVGISAGTSLISGVIQSRAANQAANTQADAAVQAAQINSDAGDRALAFNREAIALQQKNMQPWIDAGTTSLGKINGILDDPATYKMPTGADVLRDDPGIQFQLDRGQRQLNAYLGAKGLSLSGKAVKDVNEFAQGVASQGYDRAYNRFSNERAARLNPLLSLAGLGQTSVGQINSDVGNAGVNNVNITTGTAGRVGDQLTSAANARASGYVGSANAYGGALTNIGNTVLDQVTLNDILRRTAA